MKHPLSANAKVALSLAKLGLFVFPCGPDKKPLVKWSERSTREPDVLKAWWSEWPDSLPAIDCGKSDLLVIDLDRHGNADGVMAWESLLDRHGARPNDWPEIMTPGDGIHIYFDQPGDIGCGRGSLPEGIDVKGKGGYVIGPGANLPDGRRYKCAVKGNFQTPPEWLLDRLRSKSARQMNGTQFKTDNVSLKREKAYAAAALDNAASELAGLKPGSRNESLNAKAFGMGQMVGAGWLERTEVEDALWRACVSNRLVNDDGPDAVQATLASGLGAGIQRPRERLQDQPKAVDDGVSVDDFYAFMPTHSYIFTPTQEMWPATSVNGLIPPIVIAEDDGNGKPVTLVATKWLDENKHVEQMTWAPGQPMLINDRLIADGGWIERNGVTCFNNYRPPTIKLGDATKAGPWLDHARKIFGDDANHIVSFLAHRVQRPQEKINHALVLGGAQGIGKDTLLEPVKYAVGPWNFIETSPQQVLGRFNGCVKSVILRISEARDLGDSDRFSFYDHMKTYTAAPPDVLRVDEKHLREYSVSNVCGVIITTNHKTDGIYLPSDDRRHFVVWSDLTKEEFDASYWKTLWHWYDDGGMQQVAAYLATLDISAFDPKAPPPKTDAFWDIVDANRPPEEAELADVLDELGNPDAVTLADMIAEAVGESREWLEDRRNRRAIPHRLERCGYVRVRNDAAKDGMWKIKDTRQVIYAKNTLSISDRHMAASDLCKGGRS
jgi:hypothetical protein